MSSILSMDKLRYVGGKVPGFQRLFRKCQAASGLTMAIYWMLYQRKAKRAGIEISRKCKIGAGLYLAHPYCITINPSVVMGENCNIHKGVTIGQENRGSRKGTPTIGNCVWIGMNATIVGNITIGDDVLIAPNAFVNCDIPAHSVVFGNPCIIKHRENATEGYINNTI